MCALADLIRLQGYLRRVLAYAWPPWITFIYGTILALTAGLIFVS